MDSDFGKKILSYFWPLTRKVKSDQNGVLEITWDNGKKVLNSQHTNYSYGNLQKVLAHGLSQIEFDHNREALILGMGAGSIIASLREEFDYRQKITAVEIDSKIIKMAREDFQILDYSPLDIQQTDAASFVKSCTKQFGLIIIDLYKDTQVPVKFYQTPFWNHLLPLLQNDGIILFNSGLTPDSQHQISSFQNEWDGKLEFREIPFSGTTNRLLAIWYKDLD